MDALYTIHVNPDLVPPECIGILLEALSEAGIQSFLLDEAATYLAQKQEENFMDQGETFGDPWAALSERTIREKQRLGFPEQSLVRRGRLASDLGTAIVLSQNSVTVGIPLGDVPYAARLNGGDEAQNLPPRVLVALTPDMQDDLETLLRDYVIANSNIPAEAISITVT